MAWHTGDVDLDAVQAVMAQPTRARLFMVLRELGRQATTAELARRLGLHPNGVRLHLERMADAGVLTRGSEVPPRGRPRDLWGLEPAFRDGDPPSAYADLGRWLTLAMPAGMEGVRLAELGGERVGRDLAERVDGGDPVDRVRAAFALLGFQPRAEEPGGGERDVTFTLCNCPYRDAVRERPQIVCGLHRGMTSGLLEMLAPHLMVGAFVPKDPDGAGCVIRLVPVDASLVSEVGP